MGHFGFVFYFAHLAVENMTVVTNHTDDEQYVWECLAKESFTVMSDSGQPMGHGTKVSLH